MWEYCITSHIMQYPTRLTSTSPTLTHLTGRAAGRQESSAVTVSSQQCVERRGTEVAHLQCNCWAELQQATSCATTVSSAYAAL